MESRVLASTPDESLNLGHSGLAFTIIAEATHRFHIGLLYANAGAWRVLHLTGNTGQYDDDEALDFYREYVWLSMEPKLDEMCRRNLARLCTLLAKNRSQNVLPYGFSDFKHWVREDGTLAFDESKSGLTCASFVLAVLDAAHIDLIDFETWPEPDEDDKERKKRVMLWPSNDTPSRIFTLLNEFTQKRYRPEHVGGAGIESVLKCGYPIARDAGYFLLKKTKELTQSLL
jgi:hypothetical protein